MIKSTVARQYYYEREARRRAQREAERQQWIQRVREVVVSCASRYADIRRVYLFGSLLQPGRFRPESDIDLAVECDMLATESNFWRTLEHELRRDVDVRPLCGALKDIVTLQGEPIYERQDVGPDE
jgi:predicted nucleotidyltransferase